MGLNPYRCSIEKAWVLHHRTPEDWQLFRGRCLCHVHDHRAGAAVHASSANVPRWETILGLGLGNLGSTSYWTMRRRRHAQKQKVSGSLRFELQLIEAKG